MVGIPQRVKCGAKNCIFRTNDSEDDECSKDQVVKYNLKEWGYDTCVEETTIGVYKADLLLTSTSQKNRPPILIEVAVKHPCEEEKINSGLRIIEVPIKKYEDIERIIKNGIFGPDPEEYKPHILARCPQFYGFAKECYSKEVFNMRSIMIATLFSSGEIKTTMAEEFSYLRTLSLDELKEKADKIKALNKKNRRKK